MKRYFGVISLVCVLNFQVLAAESSLKTAVPITPIGENEAPFIKAKYAECKKRIESHESVYETLTGMPKRPLVWGAGAVVSQYSLRVLRERIGDPKQLSGELKILTERASLVEKEIKAAEAAVKEYRNRVIKEDGIDVITGLRHRILSAGDNGEIGLQVAARVKEYRRLEAAVLTASRKFFVTTEKVSIATGMARTAMMGSLALKTARAGSLLLLLLDAVGVFDPSDVAGDSWDDHYKRHPFDLFANEKDSEHIAACAKIARDSETFASFKKQSDSLVELEEELKKNAKPAVPEVIPPPGPGEADVRAKVLPPSKAETRPEPSEKKQAADSHQVQ